MANTDDGPARSGRSRSEVKVLRDELRTLRAQHIIDLEKHQTYVQELEATNEELRQASENLNTHRTELQTINGQLVTANRSLQGKIDELGHANGDLRNLVAATAIATVFLDRELRVTRCTPAAAKLFCLSDDDLGCPLSELRHRLHYADMEADAAAVFAHLDPIEREVSTSQGGWFLVRLLPYRTLEDQIGGVVMTCVDVTERKQAEALRQAKEAAERIARARAEFLSRVSHELRTPLNAILGFGQILELGSRDEQDTTALGLILKAGRHLLSLVNEVLDLSQVEAGELRLTLGAVDPAQLARECLQMVAKLAETNQVTCELQAPSQPLGPCWTDAQRLRQVLLNLLTNAVKYNRPGGRVILRLQRDSTDGYLFSVQDTGFGIAAGDLARLFVPFERLDRERGEIEGTGLGLAITHRLVETLGGKISVESQPGEGSRFWVRLPVNSGPAASVEAASPGIIAPPTSKVSQKKTLLYIEDNASNLQLVQMLVGRYRPRWRFVSAKNAVGGLEAAHRQSPDLILLDSQLPDRTGGWVLDELRRSPTTTHIPVLVLTADATATARERFLVGGAAGLLSKPFAINELLQTADKILQRPAPAS